MSNRAFGVEIECYAPQGDDEDYYDSQNGVNYSIDLLNENGFRAWAPLVSSDESLHSGYGAEIKSPVLQGNDGYEELTKVMEMLDRHGFYTDTSCGMHVHLNAPEFVASNRLVVKVVKAWMRNQPIINNMVDDSRLDNGSCEQWTEDDLNELEVELSNNWGPEGSLRGAINVGCLPYHGTIEIRQHEGTLNPEEAVSWIKFCQSFIDTVTGTTVQKIGTEELLLKRLKVERNASRFLTTKARINKERREARRTPF